MAEKQHLERPGGPTLAHWSDPMRTAPTLKSGSGATVVDDNGETYLDFCSQLYCVNAGYSDQRIVDAMTEQLTELPYVSPSNHSDVRTRLARELVKVAPDGLSDVLFSISGSEANELAVHLAREYTGASTVLTRWRSYHGGTYGAAGLTGDPETRSVVERHAATTGTAKFLPPMSYRSPFDADEPAELARQASEHLEFVIRNEGPDSIAALLTEPVAGTSGAYTAPPGYFHRVRELCDEYDILLIADEVITGFGRCGDWFGVQTEGIEPDLLTFAKGVTSAYAPLAGVMMRSEIATTLRTDGFPLGQTFGGHPVSCAAGVAALESYADGLLENTQTLAPVLERELAALASTHDVVGDVRGRGFLWAVEFTDPDTGEPFFDTRVDEGENPVKDVLAAAKADGALFGSGRPAFQVMVAPPLCTTEAEIERAAAILDEAISAAFSGHSRA